MLITAVSGSAVATGISGSVFDRMISRGGADSDDPGQGFQFEGGHHSNRRRAVLARRHVHGVTALVRRQDRIVWLRSFACCLLSM